jgi:hypothetical protein
MACKSWPPSSGSAVALAIHPARSPPTAAAAGRPAVERGLYDLGVRTVAIPQRAATSVRKDIEHTRGFHRLVKWRTRGDLSPRTFQVEVAT